MLWCDMLRDMLRDMLWCDMLRDMLRDMLWCDMLRDMLWHVPVFSLTLVGPVEL